MHRFCFISFLISFIWVVYGCSKPIVEVEPEDTSYRIMIVPDIQNYMDDPKLYKYLEAIADYYVGNIDDFSACFQVGDLTNNNRVAQYQVAYDHFFSKFPKGNEPYFCLGNHDYGNEGSSNVRSSNLPPYMEPVFDFRMEGCAFENYVRFLQLGSTKYAVMDLEFAARNETLVWANNVVSEYSTTPFIIITHVFTNKFGQIHDAKDDNVYHPGSQKDYSMGGEYRNDSMEIFEKLIYNNPNVIMVVCGHTFIPDYIEVTSKKNVLNKDVHIVTVNYQHSSNGGEGNVGILEINKEDCYSIRSFSTFNDEYGTINIEFGDNVNN